MHKQVDTKSKGKTGEELAVRFLRKRGYRIVYRNFKTKSGEIDIIARDGKCTVFIEVKLRESISSGYPSESVGKRKISRIQKASLFYLLKYNLSDTPYRFEVVSILKENKNYKIDLIPIEMW
ncbi:MAG: YraN family protein [Candidatus Omnitrophica bacterium]|nr:YraN family protein [Candidatus Omnitrophota bacterium]